MSRISVVLGLMSPLMLATACTSVPLTSADLKAEPATRSLRTAPPLTASRRAADDAKGMDQDATAKPATPAAPAAGDELAAAAAIGKKLSNPLSDVWALFTEFDLTSSDGRAVGSPNNSFSILFQPIMPIPLTESSKLITRPTLPMFADEPVPSEGFSRRTGIGNLSLPILWSPKKPIDLWGGQFVYAVGPTLSFPTHTTDKLGTDAWEAGPAAILVWKNDKNTTGIFPQYFWSYSEYDGQDDTSRGQFLYFYWHELGNAWQVGTAPTATFDNEATSGNKWNVPVGLAVAKTMKIGTRIVKFQLALEHSAIAQDDYGKRTQLRLNVIPVVSAPLKGPLF